MNVCNHHKNYVEPYNNIENINQIMQSKDKTL